jgi:putative phosphoesterase
VIADTHGFLPEAAAAALAGVDVIVHAGDVGDGYVLEVLEAIAPVTAVRGNNRYASEHRLPVVASVRLGGVRIALSHRAQDLIPEALEAADMRVAVTGHTHRPEVEERDGVLWVNPGSPTQPRGGTAPSIAVIEIDALGELSARIVALEGS